MDFAMGILSQLTLLLESKSIERVLFCQIQHNDDKLTNNLRENSKANRVSHSAECFGQSR